MCGILALFGPGVSKTSCDLIEKQTGLMLHRGPDEQGIETVGDDCILAHSRLSIIGVSGIGGHQPIFNASKTRALVCNGEIYNHKELRERYLDKNTVFRTNSDNEVSSPIACVRLQPCRGQLFPI
jgi:asparagine synthase (glutamine-hydrolysing)